MKDEIKLFAEYRNKDLMKKELAKWAFYEIPKLNENSQIAISYRELLLVISGSIDEARASERQIILAELKKQKIECQEGCEDHDAYNALVDAMITTVEKMKP